MSKFKQKYRWQQREEIAAYSEVNKPNIKIDYSESVKYGVAIYQMDCGSYTMKLIRTGLFGELYGIKSKEYLLFNPPPHALVV